MAAKLTSAHAPGELCRDCERARMTAEPGGVLSCRRCGLRLEPIGAVQASDYGLGRGTITCWARNRPWSEDGT